MTWCLWRGVPAVFLSALPCVWSERRTLALAAPGPPGAVSMDMAGQLWEATGLFRSPRAARVHAVSGLSPHLGVHAGAGQEGTFGASWRMSGVVL